MVALPCWDDGLGRRPAAVIAGVAGISGEMVIPEHHPMVGGEHPRAFDDDLPFGVDVGEVAVGALGVGVGAVPLWRWCRTR